MPLVSLSFIDLGMNTFWDRVEERLAVLGLTKYTVSLRSGHSKDWLRKGKEQNSIPRGDGLHALAEILECSTEYLLGADNFGKFTRTKTAVKPRVLAVRYKVEAGLWREIDEIDEPFNSISIPEDERFNGFSQWLEEVVGDSMNKLIPSGSLVHVVDAIEMGYAPTGGHIVVVERRRGHTRERTLKQIERSSDGVKLWPRSTNPKWQSAIELAPDSGEEDVEVQIVGLVIQAIRRWA